MKKKIILGIVGEMAAGKTTVTNYLKEKYGAVTFRFSDMLFDILKRVHVESTRANLQQLSTMLRSAFGEDIMSKVIARDVEEADAQFIITEGVRRPTDVACLQSLHGYALIYITADERARFERTTNRSEKSDDQTKTWEQFQKEGRQESELLIKEIAAKADFILNNNGTALELLARADTIIQKLQS